MAGFGDTTEDAILDAVFNNTSYAGGANIYAKAHTGDPGESGTANAATETTRKEVTWAAASGGTIASDAATAWTSYPASEDVTHLSFWNHLTAGTYLGSAVVTANALSSGDTLNFPTGDIDYTLD